MALTVNSGDITLNIVSFWYSITLNGINKFNIGTDGLDSTYQAEVVPGKTVEIYRGATKELTGEIENENTLPAGGSAMTGFGQEKKDLCEHHCPIDAGKHTKTWTSTGDHTIIAALLSGTGWTADTSNSTETTMDSFRVSDSQSVYQGILSMIAHNSKDIRLDYENSKVYLYDSLGSADVASFSENMDCGRMRRTTQKATYTKVIVYGKGDGTNQRIGTAGSGTPVRDIIDRNCITTTQANTRAAAELALINANIKHYTFEPNNPNQDISVGDTVTIYSDSLGEHGTALAVVQVKRGLRASKEFLQLQVTNINYRRAKKTQAEIIAAGESNARLRNSSMQGSGNYIIEGGQINADSTYPLRLEFEIDSRFEDEAGNLRVEELLLDYDIDKYRKAVGGASFTGSDPQVKNSSGSENVNTLSGNSGNQNDSSLSGNTGYTGGMDGVEQKTSDSDAGNITLKGNFDWVKIEDINPDGSETSGMFVTVAGIINGSDYLRLEFKVVSTSGTTYAQTSVFTSGEPTIWCHFQCMMFVAENTSNYNYDVYVRVRSPPAQGDETWACFTSWYTVSQHRHDASGLSSDNHQHAPTNTTADTHTNGAGDYDINSTDLNHISIGNDVEDKNLNATQLNYIYLEKYNGSPADPSLDTSWTTKYTIANTEKTLDTDVDLSNSGAYPDSKGRWRVRLLTNSASPDLVKAIVKIKSALDN